MTESEIRQAIFTQLRAIAPEADPSTIQPDANLREALDIDSFDFLNVLIGLHKSLNVEIPESDYGRLTTLADMIGYLSAKLE